MDEMNLRDIDRDIVGCIVLYNGYPVYVSRRDMGSDLIIHHIATQEEEKIKFSLKKIKPFRGRVGMVTTERGAVFYGYRIPMRVLPFGLRRNNFKMEFVQGPPVDLHIREEPHKFKEFYDAYRGVYPTLEGAIRFADCTQGACAFDKQFSVDHRGCIQYQDYGTVGFIDKNVKDVSVKDIDWHKDFTYLSVLLENDYDKAIGTLSAQKG